MNWFQGLETLLDLDGEEFYLESGYWVKFEAKRAKATEFRPHGIRYSLTLHAPDSTRIMGFDNAHSVKRSVRSNGQSLIRFDHIHTTSESEVIEYQFTNAGQLLMDFWLEVERILVERGVI